MTNVERAEEIILGCAAPVAAQALADAGLLAPEPVEPEGIEDLSWGAIAQWHPSLGLGWNDDGVIYPTTPADLRHEAACLLSAAAYAEEHTDGNG